MYITIENRCSYFECADTQLKTNQLTLYSQDFAAYVDPSHNASVLVTTTEVAEGRQKRELVSCQ